MPPGEIPDSISFGMLKQIHKEKSEKLDFSNPNLSPDIGDLAFLFLVFIKAKLGETYTHQHIFLMDVLVTRLRDEYEQQFDKLLESDVPKRGIKTHAKILSYLSQIENILDGLVSLMIKQGGFKGTMPSYQLVRSLDPSVRPHEIEEWIKGLGDLLS